MPKAFSEEVNQERKQLHSMKVQDVEGDCELLSPVCLIPHAVIGNLGAVYMYMIGAFGDEDHDNDLGTSGRN